MAGDAKPPPRTVNTARRPTGYCCEHATITAGVPITDVRCWAGCQMTAYTTGGAQAVISAGPWPPYTA